MKKRYRLKRRVKVFIILVIVCFVISTKDKEVESTVIKSQGLPFTTKLEKNYQVAVKEVKKEQKKEEKELEEQQQIIEKQETIPTPEQNEIIEEPPVVTNSYVTRMTSYYANDGYETGTITGSGLGINDFQINENGWYTYQGKLVIATATDYLLKYGYQLAQGVHTYQYYDEIILNIDGIDYHAIILDSCGASMSNGRIDLFVSGKEYVKDAMIEVKEE